MDLQQKLAQLPEKSGVYIYYDNKGKVLYVGKAKNLKNRVKQYFFESTVKPYKVSVMLKYVEDMEYILTESETDAFALENTLIKKHSPPFNIMLKDDKQYPFIKINLKESFPKLIFTRKILPDKAKYYGPIMGSVKELLKILNQLYPTRNCNHDFKRLPKNFRPCLNFHLGVCSAPCIGKISKEEYLHLIEKCSRFLRGDTAEAQKILMERMKKASDELRFEDALKYKNQLQLIKDLSQTKVATLGKLVDYDVFTIACDGKLSTVNMMLIRGGKVFAAKNYMVTDAGIDEAQTLSAFLNAYYQSTNDAGKELLTNHAIEGAEDFEMFLTNKFNRKTVLKVPLKGEKKRLIEMSLQNAREYLKKSLAAEERKIAATEGAIFQLKELLQLNALPNRIECYDISNISGVDKVASMVVALKGEKSPKHYRRFKIKTVEGANDFACMKEVLLRRFERIKNKDEKFGAVPDLIVVDGGSGQLKYAKEAMEESGVKMEMVSLAKREELVYTLNSKTPLRLPLDSYALNLLINIRDEAHRFAITYFRQLHGKNAFKSKLKEIEGVGEKRQAALMKKFKNIQSIKEATVEQLQATDGINKTIAQNIFDYFNNIF